MAERSGSDVDKSLETALKVAGWNIGDAADFLGMSDEQRQLLDLRMEMAKTIRARRAELKLSQQNLADRLKSTQSRVSLIEGADPDVSLDQLAKALILVGGRLHIEMGGASGPSTGAGRKANRAKEKESGER